MTLATALLAACCVALVATWLAGMFWPRFSGGFLAVASAALLLFPGFAVFVEAPFYLLGDFGEKDLGFPLIAVPAFALGLIALTIALIQRARRQPFGNFEEEYK